MAFKVKRPAVRFHLGSLQKNTAIDNGGTREMEGALEGGRDSGAPSPDMPPALQPAATRLLYNQQRMKMLASINDVLAGRGEHEASRGTLGRLHDELRGRARARVLAVHQAKASRLAGARRDHAALLVERDALANQVARLQEHMNQHEMEHAEHERQHAEHDQEAKAEPPAPAPALKAMDKRPSRKADQKLAAGRLLREVQQLRTRLTALERRILAENRRKKQAEDELSVLRAALSRQKGQRLIRTGGTPGGTPSERPPLRPLRT